MVVPSLLFVFFFFFFFFGTTWGVLPLLRLLRALPPPNLNSASLVLIEEKWNRETEVVDREAKRWPYRSPRAVIYSVRDWNMERCKLSREYTLFFFFFTFRFIAIRAF